MLALQPASPVIGELGQRLPQAGYPLSSQCQWRDVRLWEVAVVKRLLLAPLHEGGAEGIVPAHGHLLDFPPGSRAAVCRTIS